MTSLPWLLLRATCDGANGCRRLAASWRRIPAAQMQCAQTMAIMTAIYSTETCSDMMPKQRDQHPSLLCALDGEEHHGLWLTVAEVDFEQHGVAAQAPQLAERPAQSQTHPIPYPHADPHSHSQSSCRSGRNTTGV